MATRIRTARQGRLAATVECLETRRLLAAVPPTVAEQYMVELINRARANPGAEAARLGIALNEGVPSENAISNTPKQPLAVNPFLTDAARDHSQWMIDTDTFSHTGAGNTNPGQRMANAGYAAVNTFGWGENIAILGEYPGVPNVNQASRQLYENLFIDAGYPGRGHRVNILAEDFKEVGAGIASGPFVFDPNNPPLNAVAATQDFAYRAGNPFLTGVAYTDAVTDDNFYTPGEGLGGVTVSAVRTSDNATFNATTYASGGYSLQLPAGTYNVTASGPGLPSPVNYNGVVIGTQNVKRDYLPVADGTGPTVSGPTFLYQTSPHRVSFTFSENVQPSLAAGDVTVTRLPSGPAVTVAAPTWSGNTATFAFVGNTVLPEGNYRVTLNAAGITDAAGNALDGDGNGTPGGNYVFDFFVLDGDVDHSRTVNLADFGRLRQNFGLTAGATYGQGDLNYDGKVNLADFGILRANFGDTLAAPQSATTLASAGADSSSSSDVVAVKRRDPGHRATLT